MLTTTSKTSWRNFSPNERTAEVVQCGRIEKTDTLPRGSRQRSRRQERTTHRIHESREAESPRSLTTGDKVGNVFKAAGNFAYGLVNPLISLFRSPKHFAIGAGVITGVTALTIFTEGATIPFLLVIGAGVGIYQAAKFVSKYKSAKTPEDKAKSFKDAGEATTTLGFTLLGALGSVKAVGLAFEELGAVAAILESAEVAPALAEAEAVGALAAEEVSAIEAGESLLSEAGELEHVDVEAPKEMPKDVKRKKTLDAPSTPWNSWKTFFSLVRTKLRS